MVAPKSFNGFESDGTIISAEGFVPNNADVIPSIAQRHRTFSGFGGARSLILPANGRSIRIPVFAATAGEEIGIATYRVGAGTKLTMNFDIAGSTNCTITLDTDNFIRIFRGSSTLIVTSADVIPVDTWNYLKIVVTAREAASAGRVQVFLNGDTLVVDTGAGVDCRGQTTDDFDTILITAGLGVCHIDDYSQWATGGHGNEPLFAQLPRPTADSGVQQGVPSTGATNFGTVDEDPASIVDYNQLNVAGNEDLFTMSNLSGTPGEVRAVRTIALVTGEGALTAMRGKIKSTGVTAYGTNQATQVGGTYGCITDIFSTDPNGGGVLTGSIVDALEAGYQAN